MTRPRRVPGSHPSPPTPPRQPQTPPAGVAARPGFGLSLFSQVFRRPSPPLPLPRRAEPGYRVGGPRILRAQSWASSSSLPPMQHRGHRILQNIGVQMRQAGFRGSRVTQSLAEAIPLAPELGPLQRGPHCRGGLGGLLEAGSILLPLCLPCRWSRGPGSWW